MPFVGSSTMRWRMSFSLYFLTVSSVLASYLLGSIHAQSAACVGLGCRPLPMPSQLCPSGYGIPDAYPVGNVGDNFNLVCSPGSYICEIFLDIEQKYLYGITATCCSPDGLRYPLNQFFSLSPMDTIQTGSNHLDFQKPGGLNFLQWSYTGYYIGTSTNMQAWGVLDASNFLTMCPSGTLITGLYGSSGSTGSWLSQVRGTCNAICSACPSDQYSSGGWGKCRLCSSCAQGKYLFGCSGGSNADGSCLPCPYNTSGGGGLSRSCAPCTKCDQGYYFSGCSGGSLVDGSCSACPTGFYGAGGYDRQCTACPSGSYGCLGATALYSSCPPGSYCPAVTGVPLACPDGAYGCSGGKTSFLPCPAGSYCPSSSAATATPCGQGSFQPSASTTACTACMVGTYQSGTGKSVASNCLGCPAGKYQPITGARNSSFCIQCPAGTYSSGLGVGDPSMCLSCQAGYYQPVAGATSSSGCVKCGAGKYQSSGGAWLSSDCMLCPAGTYQTGLGMQDVQNCSLCSIGTYQTGRGLTGSAGCLKCSAGKYQSASGQGACTPCQAGTYSSAVGQRSQDGCALCRAGSYQTGLGMIGVYSCLPCWPGTYQTGMGMASNESCSLCAAGSYQAKAGATSDLDCIACGVGRYQTGSGMRAQSDCIQCGPGTFQNQPGQVSAQACIQCQPGGFQTGSGASVCIDCRPGTYQPFTGITASDQCILCPPGTFQPQSGQGASSSCLKCREGTYQTGMGAGNPGLCTPCMPGTFQTGLGMADSYRCIACGDGTYQSGVGLSSIDACLDCPPGTYQTGTGVGNISGCLQCQPGNFQLIQGSTACFQCEAGKFSLLRGQPLCASCNVGTFAPVAGMSVCRQCDPGQFLQQEGQTVCSRCPIGKFSGGNSSAICFSCMPGSYLNTTGASACNLCGAGFFTGGSGSISCDPCQNGQYQDRSGGSVCLACSAGKFQNITMASGCSNCPAGYFQDFVGQTACKMCIRAQYASGNGMQRCLFCRQGQFQPLLAATACQNCLVGQYQANPLITYCQNCTPGAFQPNLATSLCFSCAYGQFSNVSSATACVSCGPGKFQAQSNASACDLCQAGSFGPRSGSSSCVVCGPGMYQPAPGSTSCVACDRGTFLSSRGAAGQDACLPCRPGWYSNLTGVSVCVKCGPGLVSNASGSTSCANCSSGGYQTGSGGSSCTLCATGTFSLLPGMTSISACARCGAGMFSTAQGSSGCSLCGLGTYQTGSGLSSCKYCLAGSYGDVLGGSVAGCVACIAGTYSASIAATSSGVCVQCAAGYVSSIVGSKSGTTCLQCVRGKVSSPNGTVCLACSAGTYCPAGSSVQIRCVGGLVCDGQTIDAGPGLVPYVRDGCTGILPCPAGSQCALGDSLLGKGILSAAPNDTHYVIYLRGNTPNQAMLSCNQTILNYGAIRASTPIDYLNVADIVYYLKAVDCGPGAYLPGGNCVNCSAGTFSATHPAYSSSACRPCPPGAQSWSAGSTSCVACTPGRYSPDAGASSCMACGAGTVQPSSNSTWCRSCAPGSFAGIPGLSSCVSCPAGTSQPLSGASSCVSCSAGQFSSAGDASCSQCGQVSTPMQPGRSCSLAGIPDNSNDVWLTVGGNETDSCMAQGLSVVQNQAVGVRVIVNGTGGVCRHSVQFMTKPALAQTWAASWTDLRRPVSVRVVPHNATFYRQSCALQGFGVLFTVSDERGFARANLTGASAVMIIQDTSGSSVYYQASCSSMPAMDAPVPFGACFTRDFCPEVSVRVAVRLAWPDGLQMQDSAPIALGSALCTACQPTTEWTFSLDVVQACAPFLPGDIIGVQVRSLNSRAGAFFLRLTMQVMPAVQFVSFQTILPLTATFLNGVLVIAGRYMQSVESMGVINLRLVSAASNITAIVSAGTNAEITMDTYDSLYISVRSQGVSCRGDGVVAVITDYDRPTSLLAQTSKPMLVQWSVLGTPVSMFPASVSVVAVGNAMGMFRNVSSAASCVSRSPFILVSSCAGMQAVGVRDGDGAAAVDVSYMGVSTQVLLSVFIPLPANLSLFNGPDGMTGRYKLLSSLVAGRLALLGVDVTPFVRVRAVGVVLQGDRWTCSVKGAFSIAGVSGVCTGLATNAAVSQALNPTIYTGGSPSMGLFSFMPPVLQPRTPVGYVLLFQGSSMILLTALASLDSTRAVISSSDQSLRLGGGGKSSACVTISVFTGSTAPATTFLVPSMLPGPVSLSIALSQSSLVVRDDPSGLLASNASLSQAIVSYADGSLVSVLADPGIFLSSNMLSISNLTWSSTGAYGLASVSVGLVWAPCVSATASLQVYSKALVNSTMVCSACTRLALPDDPLFQQYPSDFPSSVPAIFFRVRKGLADGTTTDVFEPISVSGACTLQSGIVSSRQAGTCTISSQSAPQGYSLEVVARWAVSGALLCNNAQCQSLNVTSPGDGAGMPPFGYASSLNLSVLLTLYDQSVRSFQWLGGAFLQVNGTGFKSVANSPLLLYGRMTLDLGWAPAWSIQNSSTFVRVERLSRLQLSGPSSLQQIHCSAVWTEAVFSAYAVLSNGDTRPVVPAYNQTPPLVQHASGRFHADWAGTGTVTAVFRNFLAWAQVQAMPANQTFITGLSMDFVPDFWNGTRGQVIQIAPVFTPSLNVTGWTTVWNLTRRTVSFASSAPSAVSISASIGTMTLLADYYQAVTISGTLVACQTSPTVIYSRNSTINMIPSTSGDVDMGSETGLPFQAVPVGSVMSIPVYVFSTAPIQSYLVEISFPSVILNPLSCSAGIWQLSDCVVYNTQDRVVYRASGFCKGCQLSGKIIACTISGIPLLNGVAWMRVNLIDMVTNGATLTNPDAGFLVKMGTDPPVPGSSIVNRRLMANAGKLEGRTQRSLLATTVSSTWGDTNGDGLFTSADVLFLENYVGFIASAALSGWQMLQLCPIRDPNNQLCPVRDPKTQYPVPDGQQLLFLFRALMGKTMFLSKLHVVSLGGYFSVSVNFLDFQQVLNPVNADIMVELQTSLNTFISFQSSSRTDPITNNVLVRVMPFSSSDPLDGSLGISTASTATLSPETINFRIMTRTSDPSGTLPVDRVFWFKPVGPIGSFTVTSRRSMLQYSLVPANWSLPAPTACLEMCLDESLFGDFAIGGVVWSGTSSLQAGYVLARPAIGYLAAVAGDNPVDAWVPLPVGENFTTDEHGVFSGQAFNVTFAPLAGSSMGVYSVLGLEPVRAYSAELSGSTVFVQSGQWSREVYLEFVMPSGPPALLNISVFPLGVLDKTNALNVSGMGPVSHVSVQGLAPVIVSTSMLVLCRHAILWSLVGGKDDVCSVTIQESWHPTGLSTTSSFLCSSYPCVIQHGNRTYSPNITVYMPVSPRIVVQKPILALHQKTQWKIVCDVEPGLAKGMKITDLALAQGLVVVQPPNSLVVTSHSIQAVQLGESGLFFAGISAAVKAVEGLDVPISLTASLITNASVSVSSGTVTLDLQQNELLAGSSGRLLIHAVFGGGYQVRLDPAQYGDNVTVVRSTPLLMISPLDGSCTAFNNAQYYSGVLAVVSYLGLSASVVGKIFPLVPKSLSLCCGLNVTSPGSSALGVAGYSSNFTLSRIEIQFNNHAPLQLGIGDHRISLIYDTNILSFAQGYWSVLQLPEGVSGPSTISVVYTHPGTLVTVSSFVVINIVRESGIVLDFSPPQAILRRIHCSGVFQNLSVQGALNISGISVDVTADLTILASDPEVAQVVGHVVVPVGTGTTTITVSCRGFVQARVVRVLDENVVISNISVSPFFLVGHVGKPFPLQGSGTFEDGSDLQDLSCLMPALTVNGTAMVMGSSIAILGNSGIEPGTVTVRLPTCMGSGPSVTVPLLVSIVPLPETTDVLIGGIWDSITNISVALAGDGVTAFYVEIFMDAEVVSCIPPPNFAGIFVCNTAEPGVQVILAGASASQIPDRASLALVTTASPVTRVSGRFEFLQNSRVVHGPISAGMFGTPVADSKQGMSLVDIGTVGGLYQTLMTSGNSSTLRKLLFDILVLTGKQRYVRPAIYSNDLELSAMLRVTDRFMDQDDGASAVNVTFHTTHLPALLSGWQGPEGLVAPAPYVQDGWYAAEWRQSIPALSVSVSFSLSTKGSDRDWQRTWVWSYDGLVETGRALPACPRGAYADGILEADFLIDGVGTLVDSRNIVQELSCSLHVATRRISVSQRSDGQLVLSVGLESFARLRETNLVIMNSTLVAPLLSPYNFSLKRVQKGSVNYVNDSADGAIACPDGFYFNSSGVYSILPMHAAAGIDCYGFTCADDYQLDGDACSPTPVTSNLIWTTLVIILSIVFAVVIVIFCAQMFLVKSVADMVDFDKTDTAELQDTGRSFPVGQSPACGEEDTDFKLGFNQAGPQHVPLFPDAHNHVFLDAYSAMIVEDMFSPTQREDSE